MTGTRTLIRNVRIFDGVELISANSVVIQDGVITEVDANIAEAPGTIIVDGRGGTLLPGLIDCHVHAFPSQDGGPSSLMRALAFGVTTELDMGSVPAYFHPLRVEAQRRDDVADYRTACVPASAPGGFAEQVAKLGFFPQAPPTLSGPQAAAEFVGVQVAAGADYIKVILEDGSAFGANFPNLSFQAVQAVVDAAHAHDKLVFAHVTTRAWAEFAIEAGVDALAHLFGDQEPGPDFANKLVAGNMFVIPTLCALNPDPVGNATLLDDPRLGPYADPRWRELGRKMLFPVAHDHSGRRPDTAIASRTVALLNRLGIPVLAGSDAGNPLADHGISLHRELELLVAAGLTPSEALKAATSLAARYFSLDDRGRIASGLRADLLLVDGDPTQDITATRAIAGIWRRGVKFDRETHRTLLGNQSSLPAPPLKARVMLGVLRFALRARGIFASRKSRPHL